MTERKKSATKKKRTATKKKRATKTGEKKLAVVEAGALKKDEKPQQIVGGILRRVGAFVLTR